MICVVIVDDHPLVRAGMRAVLNATDDISVVAEGMTGKDARAGLPTVSRCLLCHKTMTSTPPLIQRLEKLPADATPFEAWFHKLPDFVFFSHARHLKAKLDCAACHGAVWEQDRPKPHVALTMKGCVDCHKASQAKIACDLCHELGQ